MEHILQQLKQADQRLFLFLNEQHNAFFDPIMYWISNKYFWIPFYLLIIILIIKHYKRLSILLLFCVGILITLSDQLSSGLIKPLAERLRPSHNPAFEGLVHLSKAGPGGMYGFVSGHATNSFALFIFLTIVLPKKFNWLKWMLGIWALLNCYSRIYVGVHYPGDVICGMILGTIVGYAVAQFYKWLKNICMKKVPYFRSNKVR